MSRKNRKKSQSRRPAQSGAGAASLAAERMEGPLPSSITEKQATDVEAEGEVAEPTPGTIASDFVWQMEALKTTLTIAGVATEAVRRKAADEFAEFSRSVGGREIKTEERITFEIPGGSTPTADRIFRQLDLFKRGRDTLASTFLVALVAEFDVFFARLLRWIWAANPKLFDLDGKSVSMAELRLMRDLRDAERALLEKEIDDLLRGSRSDQFVWLEKRLAVELGTKDPRWSDFVEAHERRHLCVHTGGRVSAQYLSNCARLGLKDLPKLGDLVQVEPSYVMSTASTFAEVAVMTSQVAWRKLDGNLNQPADESLGDITYRLIEDGKYRLAGAMLRFAVNFIKKPSSDRMKKIWIVNLAQAEKWQKNNAEMVSLLASEDWTATGLEFKLAVAVLRDEYAAADALVRQIGAEGPVSKGAYSHWPLFKEYRQTNGFKAAYRSTFGENFPEAAIEEARIKIKVDDLIADDTGAGPGAS